jgi:hypothetical protein
MTSHRSIARLTYPKAAWLVGDGRYATLAHCGGDLRVMLHETEETARTALKFIDDLGCGGGCHKHHELVDLSSAP